jgi:hypothetical protein
MEIDDFFKRYSEQGYKFSDEILTRYALSLATKPFVILSGISGTGKTKIAQLFEYSPPLSAAQPIIYGDGEVTFKITSAIMKGDRGNLQYSQINNIFEPEKVIELKKKIKDIVERDPHDGKNISEPVVISIETATGKIGKIGIYLQRASNPLVRVRVKSTRGSQESYDSTEFFNQNFKAGDVLKLEKSGVNKFKISSVNDEQVKTSNYVDEIRIASTLNNKCFISVKSNWTDSSELFGYFNPITEKYIVTKLLKFMILAHENPNYPFFVILDEMNLSKVEHYFSDFLSCLESRTVDNKGNIRQESINLYSGSQFIQTNDDEYDEICANIEIPLNLFITGTVNVDDTTYMFSPKVLDRANVIEFNDVYLDDFQNLSNFRLNSLPDLTSFNQSNLSMFDALEPDTKTHITELLNILKRTNMHFGYRTISEISHFISITKSTVNNSDKIELTALDIQILQKILPKLHGNFAKLHEPLRNIIYFLSNSKYDIESFSINEIESLDLTDAIFKRSLNKLIKMYKTLSTQGFVSFIE